MGSKMIGRGLPGGRESQVGGLPIEFTTNHCSESPKISDKYLKFHKSSSRKEALLPSSPSLETG